MIFKNAISWFEIPATDLDRAQKFYETIFEIRLTPLDMPNIKMRMFPIEDHMSGIGGAVCLAEGFYKPTATDGPLIYLNANPDVQNILDRIETAGGKIVRCALIAWIEVLAQRGRHIQFDVSGVGRYEHQDDNCRDVGQH